MHDVKN